MLKYSLLFFVTLLFADVNLTIDEKKLEFFFKNGVRDYKIGSYYDALNEFNHLAKRPQNPYYLPALKFLAKTYLQIGKRTGEKKYLWNAQNYLNTYLAKGGKKDADYYRTKALIFEMLGFHERALSNYKIALKKSKSKTEQLKAIIGILRTAVWLKKLDLATKYIVILNIENLSKEQKREFLFLKGMYDFVKGEYKKAIGAFEKSYREYESFLIENPEYYYIVAETIYRVGDMTFAQRLFRRILSYIKNKDTIQKSLLRLGDINFALGQMQRSASYYYRLIRDFPKSSYANIAKLKILFLIKQDKRLAHYIKKFLPDAPFLKEPQKFVTETLVKNRSNYVGLFALANFGKTVFELESDKLFKRLGWELSMVSVEKLKYEHKEYFQKVWSKDLVKLDPKQFCELYRSNEEFFFAVFDRTTLLKLAAKLKGCKDRKTYIDFYKKLASRFGNEDLYFRLVEALYSEGEYEQAVNYLRKIKVHECRYKEWRAKLCFMVEHECEEAFKEYVNRCDDQLYKPMFTALLMKDLDTKKFLALESLTKVYSTDRFTQKFVKVMVDRLLQDGRYEELVSFLTPLARSLKENCYLKSILALSYVRSGKIESAKSLLEQIAQCEDPWYKIALNALKDTQLQERIENVGED